MSGGLENIATVDAGGVDTDERFSGAGMGSSVSVHSNEVGSAVSC